MSEETKTGTELLHSSEPDRSCYESAARVLDLVRTCIRLARVRGVLVTIVRHDEPGKRGPEIGPVRVGLALIWGDVRGWLRPKPNPSAALPVHPRVEE